MSIRSEAEPRALPTDGLAIALEPIVCAGAEASVLRPDGRTMASGDGSPTAHHQRPVVVRAGSPPLLAAA